MLGEPLVGPTYAVTCAECTSITGDSLKVFVGIDNMLHVVKKTVVSEDSEVLRAGDTGTLVILESEARSRGWVDEAQTSGAREARQLADAVAERRLDKLPLTPHGARTALSLTFQIWSEWRDAIDEPVCDMAREKVEPVFLEWIHRLVPAVLSECHPTLVTGDADAVRAPWSVKPLPLNDKLGAYSIESRSGDRVEDGPDGLTTLRRESGQPVVTVATAGFNPVLAGGAPGGSMPWQTASWYAKTAALPEPRACVRTDSRDSSMLEHTGDVSCPVCNPPRTAREGQCPWCTACYSTRGELLRHLDAVGRHEGARLVLAEARVHDLESRVAALQAVVDAYGRDGHSVVVRAGDDGEVDVWSDGHPHAFAPLSTVRALREELAEARASHEEQRAALCEGIERYKTQRNRAEDVETKLRAELNDALRGLNAALERASSAESQLAREDGTWTGTP